MLSLNRADPILCNWQVLVNHFSIMTDKKLVKSKSGLRMVPLEGDLSPFYFPEPTWSRDAEVRDCSGCAVSFSLLLRKHHCRRCGKIFCGKCCKRKLNLYRMHFLDPVLHCIVCSKVTSTETSFFENGLRVLASGAYLSASGVEENSGSLYIAKLSSDYTSVVFQTDSIYNLNPIKINSITHVVPVSTTKGNFRPMQKKEFNDAGLSADLVVHHNVEKTVEGLRFSAGPGPHRQQAMLWLEIFLEGIQMIQKDQVK